MSADALTPTLRPTRRILTLPDSPASARGDYSPRAHAPLPEPAGFSWRRARMLLLCAALIFTMTAEVIVRKINVTNMKNYIAFLQMLFVFACAVGTDVLYLAISSIHHFGAHKYALRG